MQEYHLYNSILFSCFPPALCEPSGTWKTNVWVGQYYMLTTITIKSKSLGTKIQFGSANGEWWM